MKNKQAASTDSRQAITSVTAGLIVGLAIGTGGLGVTLLGWIADHWGLQAALHLIGALPLAGLAIAFCLPEPRA